MSHETPSPLDTCYAEYATLPKEFGSVPAATLLELADLNAKRADSLNNRSAVKFHSAAGSAYIEAMLTESHNIDTVDDSLGYIADAERHLRLAADGEYQLLENGVFHPNYQDNWQRAEAQLDFINVYRDIVCGEITHQTRNELIEKLQYRRQYAEATGKMDGGSKLRGFEAELRLFLKVWKNHHTITDPIAFPSTERGGSGTERRSQTHDAVFGMTTDGLNWAYRGVEIKGGRKNMTHELTRYTNMLIHINPDDRLTVYEPMS